MLALVVFLILVVLVVPIEHLAFGRHPRLVDNEPARRAIGIGTVMGLGLIPVAFGDLDVGTWVALLAGFLLAGVTLGVMLLWERHVERASRVAEMRRVIHEHIERWNDADASEQS